MLQLWENALLRSREPWAVPPAHWSTRSAKLQTPWQSNISLSTPGRFFSAAVSVTIL